MKIIILKPDKFVKLKNVIGFLSFEEEEKGFFSDGKNEEVEVLKSELTETTEKEVMDKLLEDEEFRYAASFNELIVAHEYEDDYLNYIISYE